MLKNKAKVGTVDAAVRISLGFGDRFRHRRAARTVIGDLRKRCLAAAD